MTVISLAHSNIVRSHFSACKKEDFKKGKATRVLAIFLIFFIAAAIFLYVLQVNRLAAKGYQIGELKKQVYESKEKNKSLQINISNLKSIDNLQTQIADFDMIRAENIEYVNLISTSVVAAK